MPYLIPLNFASTGLTVLSMLFGFVQAHGDMDMDAAHGDNSTVMIQESDYPPTYFGLADHRGLVYGHVSLMILAWVFVLPVGKCPKGSDLAFKREKPR
jgi:hypothetical protein